MAYYIIRPNSKLNTQLGPSSADVRDLLADPVLWTFDQGGRSAFTLEDTCTAVKCLFVANLKYNLLTEIEIQRTFDTLEVSATSFDNWWCLEFFNGYDQSASEIASALASSTALTELQAVESESLQALMKKV